MTFNAGTHVHSRALAALAIGALALAGCSNHGTSHSPGAMPEGGTYHGAYLSPQYGDMHLCMAGGHIIGSYERGDRTGEIRGEVEGDTLWFSWKEEREYVPGQPIESEGLGYFVLTINEDGDPVLTGEWGHDDSRTDGGAWTAVKRRRTGPDSCDGSQPETQERELSWDEEQTSEGGEGDGLDEEL